MRDDTVETASDSAHDATLSGTFGKLNLQVRAWIGELTSRIAYILSAPS